MTAPPASSPPLPDNRAQWRREALVPWLGLVVILVLSAAAALVLARGRQDVLDTWAHTLESFSATMAEHAAQTFRNADLVLGRVVDHIQAEGVDSPEALRERFGDRAGHELLRERAREVPMVDSLVLIGPDGMVINSAHRFPLPAMSLADREYHRVHRTDPALELFIAAPVRSRTSGQWVLILARKLRAPDGRPIGLVGVGLQVNYFERFYSKVSPGGLDGTAMLLRADGALMARHPPRADLLGRSLRDSAASRALDAARHQGRVAAVLRTRGAPHSDPDDARARIVAVHAVPGLPLSVAVTAAEEVLLRDWRRTAWLIGGATLALDTGLAAMMLWIARLLRRRREAQQALETASRVKSQFLANMSHEIRTPLHGMLGMARQLLDAPLAPAQREQAEVIARSGRLLLGVIDDVLDFSRIEAGGLELERVPFDLAALAQDCVALFRPQAEAKGLVLALALDAAAAEAPVLGDPLRLAQILNNLLSNAIKFTPAGRVLLRVARQDDEHWRLAVADSGIGLDDAQQRRVFAPFMQSDSSTTRRFGGTGLGLAIVSSLVQLHGGELGVDSQPGQGAEFWLVLRLPRVPSPRGVPVSAPTAAAPAPAAVPPADAPPDALAGREVLVAEDNEVNMMLACAILGALGLRVRQAVDGREAVAAYGAQRPDVVLMDMHMPELDGLDAARQIRALEAATGTPRTPILALTASALPEDRRRCLDAGMDDVLVKPFDAAQLQARLRECLEGVAP